MKHLEKPGWPGEGFFYLLQYRSVVRGRLWSCVRLYTDSPSRKESLAS